MLILHKVMGSLEPMPKARDFLERVFIHYRQFRDTNEHNHSLDLGKETRADKENLTAWEEHANIKPPTLALCFKHANH